MKSQGLPLNFIVLAAIAILILVLVVAFVMGGRSALGGEMTMEAAKTYCHNLCNQISTCAQSNDITLDTAETGLTQYCGEYTNKWTSENLKIKGKTYSCQDLVGACQVQLADGAIYSYSGTVTK